MINKRPDQGSQAPAAALPSTKPVAACGQPVPPTPSPRFFRRGPVRLDDRNVDYVATVYTSCGDISIDLLEDQAPIAVSNFIFLARQGFYDGLIWHQVSPGFIIQAGDPNGDNSIAPNGPGYVIKDELPPRSRPYLYGTVGMANAGEPDTGGSQFFIVVHDYEGAVAGSPGPLKIEPKYTVFGRVLPRFYGSVETIARQQTLGVGVRLIAERPIQPIYIEKIDIFER